MSKNIDLVASVAERLKLSPIGDLVTEDDLREIVKDAIQKTFFEERITRTNDGWRNNDVRKPPLIVEVMGEVLKDAAAGHVKAWLDENPDVVIGYWKKVMDIGLIKYVEDMVAAKSTENLRTIMQAYTNTINQDRISRGLPALPAFF